MPGRHISGARAERLSVDEAFSQARATRSAAGSGASASIAPTLDLGMTPVLTRPTVRLLMLRGLAQAEATTLTAFLCGIPVTDCHWSLREINELLFLRDLNRRGRFGPTDP